MVQMILKTINGIEKRFLISSLVIDLSRSRVNTEQWFENGQVFVQFAQQPFAAGGMRVCYKVHPRPFFKLYRRCAVMTALV